MFIQRKSDGRQAAFTLLEMMLSVAVFVILVTSAFSLVGATTELMTEVSEVQTGAAERMRFIETCRVAFESMSGNSSLEFHYFDRGGGRFDTYLTFVDAPAAFDFGANSRDEIRRVALAAEIQPAGFIRCGVYYLNDLDFEAAMKSDFLRVEAPYVELVPKMRQLTWRFYDPLSREWKQSLDGNLRSNLAELTFQIEGGSPPLRSVFWHLNGSR
ncbi:MAG: prepilin-type N-terminal cleavage/methylation domain-containing protein [Verrucomicrobiae bacterium]|nr:prepilin-type N-terminal cleavage/methylation domain-containing protein [Verrucomicrobiae bacterium]